MNAGLAALARVGDIEDRDIVIFHPCPDLRDRVSLGLGEIDHQNRSVESPGMFVGRTGAAGRRSPGQDQRRVRIPDICPRARDETSTSRFAQRVALGNCAVFGAAPARTPAASAASSAARSTPVCPPETSFSNIIVV